MPGFPPETIAFLTALREHDDRGWFDRNRAAYESGVLEPARAFVEVALNELRTIAPDLQGSPRVGGSIVRLDRDRRTTDGRGGYADHLDLWFWDGPDRAALSGFFLRIAPDTVTIGAGATRFDREQLEAFRAAVAHPRAGACLVDVTKELARKGYRVQGEHYARTPRGVDLEGERERLVRFNALWCDEQVEHPSILHNGRFLRWCLTRWHRFGDLHRWLVDEVA